MKMLAIIGLSLATALSGVAPAQAFPSIDGPKFQVSDVQQVRQRRYSRQSQGSDYYRRSWGVGRWGGNRDCNHRRCYYGHRRHYGDRYRDYDDDNFGAVLGGLAAGAIIGGLIAQPRYYGGGGTHANWCYSRYRSYRAYDNTFQPYYGPRRQCVSPY